MPVAAAAAAPSQLGLAIAPPGTPLVVVIVVVVVVVVLSLVVAAAFSGATYVASWVLALRHCLLYELLLEENSETDKML